MPAIIPGYEYDIFSSYRQNDNLPDRQAGLDAWVTRFAEALDKELKPNIKKRGLPNIYFCAHPKIMFETKRGSGGSA